MVATYSVAEAKNRLTALIAAAERGEAVTITRHGRPVVELRAVGTELPPRRPRPMDKAAMERLLRALAALDLPRMEVDGVQLVDEMREADYDPDIAATW